MIEPVLKSVWVATTPEMAFRRFTAEIDTWWPRATHSVSEERCRTVRFEGGEGGRLVEEDDQGIVHPWGDVRVWEPPHRLAFSWHPGRGPDTAQDVEVTFTAEDDGTRVRVEHRGWERLGERARESRANYDRGWATVLGLYVGSLGSDASRAAG